MQTPDYIAKEETYRSHTMYTKLYSGGRPFNLSKHLNRKHFATKT